MNYDILIETLTEIINNEKIYKDGLTMVYSLEPKLHRTLSEHFYYKINGNKSADYEYTEEFEIEIADILVKFVISE